MFAVKATPRAWQQQIDYAYFQSFVEEAEAQRLVANRARYKWRVMVAKSVFVVGSTLLAGGLSYYLFVVDAKESVALLSQFLPDAAVRYLTENNQLLLSFKVLSYATSLASGGPVGFVSQALLGEQTVRLAILGGVKSAVGVESILGTVAGETTLAIVSTLATKAREFAMEVRDPDELQQQALEQTMAQKQKADTEFRELQSQLRSGKSVEQVQAKWIAARKEKEDASSLDGTWADSLRNFGREKWDSAVVWSKDNKVVLAAAAIVGISLELSGILNALMVVLEPIAKQAWDLDDLSSWNLIKTAAVSWYSDMYIANGKMSLRLFEVLIWPQVVRRIFLQRMMPFITSVVSRSANKFFGADRANLSVGDMMGIRQLRAGINRHYESDIQWNMTVTEVALFLFQTSATAASTTGLRAVLKSLERTNLGNPGTWAVLLGRSRALFHEMWRADGSGNSIMFGEGEDEGASITTRASKYLFGHLTESVCVFQPGQVLLSSEANDSATHTVTAYDPVSMVLTVDVQKSDNKHAFQPKTTLEINLLTDPLYLKNRLVEFVDPVTQIKYRVGVDLAPMQWQMLQMQRTGAGNDQLGQKQQPNILQEARQKGYPPSLLNQDLTNLVQMSQDVEARHLAVWRHEMQHHEDQQKMELKQRLSESLPTSAQVAAPDDDSLWKSVVADTMDDVILKNPDILALQQAEELSSRECGQSWLSSFLSRSPECISASETIEKLEPLAKKAVVERLQYDESLPEQLAATGRVLDESRRQVGAMRSQLNANIDQVIGNLAEFVKTGTPPSSPLAPYLFDIPPPTLPAALTTTAAATTTTATPATAPPLANSSEDGIARDSNSNSNATSKGIKTQEKQQQKMIVQQQQREAVKMQQKQELIRSLTPKIKEVTNYAQTNKHLNSLASTLLSVQQFMLGGASDSSLASSLSEAAVADMQAALEAYDAHHAHVQEQLEKMDTSNILKCWVGNYSRDLATGVVSPPEFASCYHDAAILYVEKARNYAANAALASSSTYMSVARLLGQAVPGLTIALTAGMLVIQRTMVGVWRAAPVGDLAWGAAESIAAEENISNPNTFKPLAQRDLGIRVARFLSALSCIQGTAGGASVCMALGIEPGTASVSWTVKELLNDEAMASMAENEHLRAFFSHLGEKGNINFSSVLELLKSGSAFDPMAKTLLFGTTTNSLLRLYYDDLSLIMEAQSPGSSSSLLRDLVAFQVEGAKAIAVLSTDQKTRTTYWAGFAGAI